MSDSDKTAPRIGTLPEMSLVTAWAAEAVAAAITKALANGTLTPKAAVELCGDILDYEQPILHDAEPMLALARFQGAVLRAAAPAVRQAYDK